MLKRILWIFQPRNADRKLEGLSDQVPPRIIGARQLSAERLEPSFDAPL